MEPNDVLAVTLLFALAAGIASFCARKDKDQPDYCMYIIISNIWSAVGVLLATLGQA